MAKRRYSKKGLKRAILAKHRLIKLGLYLLAILLVCSLGQIFPSPSGVEAAVAYVEGCEKLILHVTLAVLLALFCVRKIASEASDLVNDLEEYSNHPEEQIDHSPKHALPRPLRKVGKDSGLRDESRLRNKA